MTRTIAIQPSTGDFAEDKDMAQQIRTAEILPALEAGDDVVLDFSAVGLATQSFVHALISDVIRRHGPDVLDRIGFKDCTATIKGLIGLVAEYSQQGLEADSLGES